MLEAGRAGARFFYEPTVLARWRKPARGITHDLLRVQCGARLVHLWHADLVDDRRLVRTVLASDLYHIARLLVDEDRLRQARAAFVTSLRHRPTPRGPAWALLLSAPERYRRTLIDASVSLKRAVSSGGAVNVRRDISARADTLPSLRCWLGGRTLAARIALWGRAA